MLVLNGVSVKSPKSMKVTIQDIDGETGRNANGDLIRDRITTKRKIECEWGLLAENEIRAILNAVSPEFFSIKYIDPLAGTVTKTFYAGDKSSPVYSFSNRLKPWSGLKVNFIEQ